jgi:2-keto-3-deoxy-L-rhamnonate aldolase RhmA
MFLRTAPADGGPREGTAFGAWVKLPGVESPEILADAGFDFLVVDTEHTLLDLAAVERHLVLGRTLGMRVFVRVPGTDQGTIQRLLDGGAHGVVVPHVDDVATARRVVAASHFPPRGTRGSGGTSRAGRFGTAPRADYLAGGGGVVAQVESVASVLAVEEIAAVEGLGALLLGQADLGLDPRRGGLGSPADVAAAVIAAGHAAGVPVGTACSPGAAAAQRDAGFDFVVCANDATLLASAARDVIRSLTPTEEAAHA